MKVKELKEHLRKGKKLKIYDIRESSELVKGKKMYRAKHVPMGQVFLDAAKGKLPKKEKIVLVCKSGGRCKIVVKELKKKGYDVDYLEGGIMAWNKDDKKPVRKRGK